MNTLPIELIEQIISNLPATSLSNICHTNKTLYILSRIELYKRWRECAIQFGKIYYEDLDLNKDYEKGKLKWAKYDELSCYNAIQQHIITMEQVTIMKIMLENKMIVDPQELEIFRYCTSEWNWAGTPLIWGFDWEWEPDEYGENLWQ